MEVVCLIWGPTITSCVSTIPIFFAYILSFDIPTPSFIYIENVYYYSCFYCFSDGVNIFCVDYRNTGASYNL